MSDIIAGASITISAATLPRFHLRSLWPRLGLARTVEVIADAVTMAYVKPYEGAAQSCIAEAATEAGRDPSW